MQRVHVGIGGDKSVWSVCETSVRVRVCLLETTKLDQAVSGRPAEPVRVPGMRAEVRQRVLMLKGPANVCVCEYRERGHLCQLQARLAEEQDLVIYGYVLRQLPSTRGGC